jgi:sigma-B regulation protein RsbU (phosphoserine phosphatase)
MRVFLFALKRLWRRLSALDVVAVALAVIAAIMTIAPRGIENLRGMGLLQFLGLLAGLYLLVRFIGWWRARLLWSLRNRLIVAYLFVAVVPVALLLTLTILAGQLLYSQLGAYLLYEDIHSRLSMLADSAENIAAAEATLPASIPDKVLEDALDAQIHIAHSKELPGLKINFHTEKAALRRLAPSGADSFHGIVQSGSHVRLVALKMAKSQRGESVIELTVGITPEFLATIAPDLGAITVTSAERVEGADNGGAVPIGGNRYRFVGRTAAEHRSLQPPGLWIDPAIDGFSKLDAAYLEPSGGVERGHPVFASFTARPSLLNQRIFSSLGEFRSGRLLGFQLVAVALLLIELAALVTGIVLTRAITSAVAELYRATQFVQSGDLSHRVRIERRDQLGVLGESFNLMTGSISGLIEEQKKRQRLENEISIAREVQNQLFPQRLPQIPGVEMEAICKAARTVSGDYYDFIQLSPTQLAIAIADISGKGISAALLMASLQAALRSQIHSDGGSRMGASEIVARLNNHLVRNTADDRFATFFIAIFDSASRRLCYTNAGHLPAFCICDGKVQLLSDGGMVLGVVEDYEYQQGSIRVPPNALLIAYSDGLVEPENVYGEEFGVRRLQEAAVRVENSEPRSVAEALMQAAEEWAGTPEQADDMTVIVARLR